jgi:hypothetical protein
MDQLIGLPLGNGRFIADCQLWWKYLFEQQFWKNRITVLTVRQ